MTYAWRRKPNPEAHDFVFTFAPKADITTLELAKLIMIGMGHVQGSSFRCAPIDLVNLSETLGSAYRHLREIERPPANEWPVLRYRPSLKRAA